MMTLELSPSVFAILSGLVEEKAGLHYSMLDRELLQEKASARALEVGFESLLDYYYYLRYDPAGERELVQLIDNLVVNETYFFREWQTIEVLVSSFIEPWCKEGRRPRILSAACSTGEEPLSLSMALDERGLLDQVDLVACDISSRALGRAQEGRFGKRAVRQIPSPRLLERYIRPDAEGYSVDSRLISKIDWQRRNLLSDEDFAQLGTFDVILCRNVLIYFADATVRQVLERLARSLASDGVLLVGISESLLRYGSRFIGEERGGAFVYRKADSP